jgi:hypothetical protein
MTYVHHLCICFIFNMLTQVLDGTYMTGPSDITGDVKVRLV